MFYGDMPTLCYQGLLARILTSAGRIAGLRFNRKPWLTDTFIRAMGVVTGSLETNVGILKTLVDICNRNHKTSSQHDLKEKI